MLCWKSNLGLGPTDRRGRTVSELAETATKPLPAPLQKHSLGGCITDMPPHRIAIGGAYRVVIFW